MAMAVIRSVVRMSYILSGVSVIGELQAPGLIFRGEDQIATDQNPCEARVRAILQRVQRSVPVGGSRVDPVDCYARKLAQYFGEMRIAERPVCPATAVLLVESVVGSIGSPFGSGE